MLTSIAIFLGLKSESPLQRIKEPELIQLCEVTKKKFIYDCMGAEFEWGARPESLNRIFARGVESFKTKLKINMQGEKDISVYLVAGKGFSLTEYEDYLKQMAEGRLRMEDRIEFDDAVKKHLGVELDFWDMEIETNAWFDIINDVLWTLSEEVQENLISHLENIKKQWAEKEKAH